MIKQTVKIPGGGAKEIFDVLMDSDLHTELTGDKAVIDPVEGGEFSTFGGYSSGKNIELVVGQLVRQTWRAGDWPEGHFSEIKFELRDVAGGAEIAFEQKDLPAGTEAEFRAGWEDNYWSPLIAKFA